MIVVLGLGTIVSLGTRGKNDGFGSATILAILIGIAVFILRVFRL